jgi:hypothetical protein
MADDEQQGDRDLTGPGGQREQPPPTGTEPQAPAHETALTELTEATGAAGSGGGRQGELMEKRRTKGLSDAEAEELGELLAQQEGKPHSSAQSLKRGPAAED